MKLWFWNPLRKGSGETIKVAASDLKRAHRPDYVVTVLVLGLIGIGLVMLYSTGAIVSSSFSGGLSDKNTYFQNQILSLGIGLVGWFVAAKINYRHWQRWATIIFFASLGLMLLVMIPPLAMGSHGATRWLNLGVVSFQPVEFFKLGLILYLASWLSERRGELRKFFEGQLPFFIVLAVAAFLTMILQKDMGSGMVVIAIMMGMYWLSGVPVGLYASSLLAMGGGALLLVKLYPHRLARLTTFLHSNTDPTGAGYHINQALIAIGSGGIFGRGLGQSLQAYGYLPESTNDSIFAIIGEEFGFLGSLLVVGLFGVLIARGMKIVKNAPDNFARLAAMGIISWIGAQAVINIAAMLNLIPLTGVPLPFISFGGTSLLALLVAVGILQNISKHTIRESAHADRRLGRGNRRAYHPDTGYATSAS